ncbi:dedicator of cytokinesis protein 3-like [Tenrec ecaudatus]|uniref:dedicator of cytokinesis protein 3-like n=1 Tax=Tenrec ecaudatus TaxID=94439 RepID=UPI003F5A8314
MGADSQAGGTHPDWTQKSSRPQAGCSKKPDTDTPSWSLDSASSLSTWGAAWAPRVSPSQPLLREGSSPAGCSEEDPQGTPFRHRRGPWIREVSQLRSERTAHPVPEDHGDRAWTRQPDAPTPQLGGRFSPPPRAGRPGPALRRCSAAPFAGHYLHFDAFHHALSDTPPALPARTLRKSPLHPIPASPTSPQSGLDGSNSTLSGSASSGVSSLSESNFGHCSEAAPRADAADAVPSPAWAAAADELEPPYLPVHYSLSEASALDARKGQPCRSHSAPGCVAPQDPTDPPALPPKPYHPHPHAHMRPPALGRDDAVLPREEAERPRGLHRKASLPPAGAKEEQTRLAWEHGRGEQ